MIRVGSGMNKVYYGLRGAVVISLEEITVDFLDFGK